jgi:co-chaperonin GroES (HSP10)
MEKIIYPPVTPETTTYTTESFEKEERLTDEQMEQALPVPTGHKLLIALPKVEDNYDGTSIVKVDTAKHAEQVTSVVAIVLDMGPDAYKDRERFPSGPWCEVGNYVLVGPYKGIRFLLNGQEFRIINDDLVEGIVADPKGYRRL